MKSEIHAVIFHKAKWTPDTARKWLKEHDLVAIKKMRQTVNFYRYRIVDPDKYKRFSTVMGPVGVEIILGYW